MDRSPWPIKLTGGVGVNLFDFPYSGGNAASYTHWRHWLPTDAALLYGVQLPGRGQRMTALLIADTDELLKQLVPELPPRLTLPYVLYGHITGALMAFAVLNRLLQLGTPAPEAIILSGKRSPQAIIKIFFWKNLVSHLIYSTDRA
jgi:medium-chain acyl-[acyl-carrier-protein] hydrolase